MASAITSPLNKFLLTWLTVAYALSNEDLPAGNSKLILPWQTAANIGPGICPGCSCGVPNPGVNLVSGELISGNQFPWLAAIYVNGIMTGGGTLISNRDILTSATTVNGISPSDIAVALGESNVCNPASTSANLTVSTVSIDPLYNNITRAADLAVLRLNAPVAFGNSIRPVCLPARVNSNSQNNIGIVTSWGPNTTAGDAATATCEARILVAPTFGREGCILISNVSSILLTPDKGCIGVPIEPSSICPSDSGAPVYYRSRQRTFYIQVGVLSPGKECNSPGAELFTRVGPGLPWIISVTRDSCYCRAPTLT